MPSHSSLDESLHISGIIIGEESNSKSIGSQIEIITKKQLGRFSTNDLPQKGQLRKTLSVNSHVSSNLQLKGEFLNLDESQLFDLIGAPILIVIEKELDLKAMEVMLDSMGAKSETATSDE